MSKRLLYIILLISLAFNIAVLGMFAYVTIYKRQPFCQTETRYRMDRDANEHRDEDKRFFNLNMENREEIRKLRAEFKENRRDFMEMLWKEDFNEQDALAAMETSINTQQKLDRTLGEALIKLRKNMSQEEAMNFIKEHRDRMKDRYKTDKHEFMNKIQSKKGVTQ